MKFIGDGGWTRALAAPLRLPRGGRCAALAAIVALAAAGCATDPKPTQVTGGTVEGSAQLNPSVNKRPSPLVLRIYELKNATAFGSADFVALFERDKAELAADIVSRDEITLLPGETRTLPAKTLVPEVKFIAVMGAFRELERARWRSVVQVLPNRKQSVSVRADANSVSVTLSPVK